MEKTKKKKRKNEPKRSKLVEIGCTRIQFRAPKVAKSRRGVGVCVFGARDWTRVRSISTSFWPFRLIRHFFIISINIRKKRGFAYCTLGWAWSELFWYNWNHAPYLTPLPPSLNHPHPHPHPKHMHTNSQAFSRTRTYSTERDGCYTTWTKRLVGADLFPEQ